jgi:hypothetical protein
MAERSPWERLGEEGPGAGGAAHDRWQKFLRKECVVVFGVVYWTTMRGQFQVVERRLQAAGFV